MSNVVINNRNIANQTVKNIENGKVFLPFNVNKEQIKKLNEILEKVKVTFIKDEDKLEMNKFVYNGTNVKSSNKDISNGKFTLSKTYVVTMKKIFINKVKAFYEKIAEEKVPERPVFTIDKEINLQAALKEATAEIDLIAINSSLNVNKELPNEEKVSTAQVLANNPLGETIIENPVNLNENKISNTEEQPDIKINGETQQNPVNMSNDTNTIYEKEPKIKVKRLKGNVLIVPVIVVWLGIVLLGSVKLVTSILS